MSISYAKYCTDWNYTSLYSQYMIAAMKHYQQQHYATLLLNIQSRLARKKWTFFSGQHQKSYCVKLQEEIFPWYQCCQTGKDREQ